MGGMSSEGGRERRTEREKGEGRKRGEKGC